MLEKKLKEHGIQVVIDMNGIEADDEHQEAEIATVARLGLEHHRFKLHGDGTGDSGEESLTPEGFCLGKFEHRPRHDADLSHERERTLY